MHLGYTTNEYGTRVSMHRCWTCGEPFTVCPAKDPEDDGWDDCLAPSCPSYDPKRDADKLFDDGVPIGRVDARPERESGRGSGEGGR